MNDRSSEDPERAVPQADVPAEEERLLARVLRSLAMEDPNGAAVGVTHGQQSRTRSLQSYDAELVALRDEIGEARLEDVPPLIAQMERLQGVSLRRAQAGNLLVERGSPYFGHLRVSEQNPDGSHREREILIGRATWVDTESGVKIVDWRDAPVSQLYYRYAEGDAFEETLGDREIEGQILVRRTVSIERGRLVRVMSPQATWSLGPSGWVRTDHQEAVLSGGQGTAVRPGTPRALGLAASSGDRLDRRLPEIAALLDPRQFELITDPDSRVVLIQGGAGSGKTTVGLHRMAFLARSSGAEMPAQQALVVTHGEALADYISQVLPALGVEGVRVVSFAEWAQKELRRAIPGLHAELVDDVSPLVSRVKSHPALLHALGRRVAEFRGRPTARAVIELWAELLTNRKRLCLLLQADPEIPISARELAEAEQELLPRISAVLDLDPAERIERRRAARRDAASDDDDIRGETGIDGQRTDEQQVELDIHDLALLLRAHQLLCGAQSELDHLFVDEAQDLSPAALSVLIAHTSSERSITLAGDTAQRLSLDNGFTDWLSVARHLGLSGVPVEPLRISYRSTREILALSRYVMGPLGDSEPSQAPRSGAPVEAFRFPGTGAAVGFLAQALRPLSSREPRAMVAILARHPEQADRYFEGLSRAEVASIRRVRYQDFSFRPGIEVTDIRQAKGLEFDYVVLVDVNAESFGADDESRHLLHIAATRAAHQLWIVVTASPSPLLPEHLRG
jgi:DNA helicase-2/ATP-dependent DNA helicase PcrA